MYSCRFCSLCSVLVVLAWATAAGADAAMPSGAQPLVVAAEAGGGHEGHEHGSHEQGASGHEGHTANSPGAAWAELRGVRDAIAADVEAGQLGEVHAKSERLEPLAKALLDASKDLAADKRARVESAVKQMPKVADALHEAADSGNADATRRELKRLDGVLELIRAQYPPEALSSSAPSPGEHGHAMHGHVQDAGGPSGHTHAERPLAAVEVPPQATIRVHAGEYSFEPQRLELRAGVPTRIELENEGILEHSLIVRTPDGKHDWIHLHAPVHGTDASTFELDRPGSYPVLCTIAGHTEAGMVGELIVIAR